MADLKDLRATAEVHLTTKKGKAGDGKAKGTKPTVRVIAPGKLFKAPDLETQQQLLKDGFAEIAPVISDGEAEDAEAELKRRQEAAGKVPGKKPANQKPVSKTGTKGGDSSDDDDDDASDVSDDVL